MDLFLKMYKYTFFHEKNETFKKIFFIKVLKNGKNDPLPFYFHHGNEWKRTFLIVNLSHLYQAENIL